MKPITLSLIAVLMLTVWHPQTTVSAFLSPGSSITHADLSAAAATRAPTPTATKTSSKTLHVFLPVIMKPAAAVPPAPTSRPAPTQTPAATKTAIPTATRTVSATRPALPTATRTAPATPTASATRTALPTATRTPLPPPINTPRATNTVAPVPSTTPTAVSSPTPAGSWWKPSTDLPIHWSWQLGDDFVYPRDVLPGVTVYDVDGEFTSTDTVAKLHALGPNIKVICYIAVGAYATYNSDASRFPASIIGNTTGWDNSYWVDIRRTDILLPIMKDRMQMCKDKGFDGIEPDDSELWDNPNSGFTITRDQNIAYNIKLAELAHSVGISIGLKNNHTEAPDVGAYYDWSLTEACWQYNECGYLKTAFLDHGKAVFNIEYNVDPNCATANSWHMNSARRDKNLEGPANTSYRYTPCVPDSQNHW